MKLAENKRAKALFALIQHLALGGLVFCLVMIFAGQSVILTGARGNVSYDLFESDRSRPYEDSVLFNNILGNNLSTLARFVAIRSQLETDGVYDGTKVIDVTAYVNRGTTLPGDYITARYTVENLLKWSQNGFDYETRLMTDDESRRFLADETLYTRIINNAVSGGMNSYLNAQIDGNTETRRGEDYSNESRESPAWPESESWVSFDDMESNELDQVEHSILINRYRTVEGYNIEDIVSDWNEYLDLCSNIIEVAQDLNRNYEEYQKYRDYYTHGNSLLRYYIVRSIGGRREVFTNVDELYLSLTNEEISGYFSGLKRHLFYCPYDLSYETDTLIKEDTVRSIFKQYSYAYPDQIRCYFGVDLGSLGVADDFSTGRELSARYLPSVPLLQFFAVLFLLCFVAMTVLRIIFSGTGQYAADRLPTELIIVIWAGVFTAAFWFFIDRIWDNSQYIGQSSRFLFPLICAVCAALMDAVLMCGLYCLIRKGKSGRLWQDSGLRRLCLFIKKVWLFTLRHTNMAVSTWLPYIALMAGNILAVAFLGIQGIVIAVIADAVVGFLIYASRIRRREIVEGIERINEGDTGYKLPVSHMYGENRRMAEAVNAISVGIDEAVNRSMQDERMRTDLITNVSHDIKTPLTSIINYVDLLKRENIDNEKAQGYINILDEKSQRLKHLTEDLLEASRISSGNIELNPVKIDLVEFTRQSLGEFSERFEERGLKSVFTTDEDFVYINADAHSLWRVAENLMGNAAKYSLENTRIYLELGLSEAGNDGKKDAVWSIKNISEQELNVDPRELTERFIRGDKARTGEGSGLGLSIALNLTKAMGGKMSLCVDGDLFKATLTFPLA